MNIGLEEETTTGAEEVQSQPLWKQWDSSAWLLDHSTPQASAHVTEEKHSDILSTLWK